MRPVPEWPPPEPEEGDATSPRKRGLAGLGESLPRHGGPCGGAADNARDPPAATLGDIRRRVDDMALADGRHGADGTDGERLGADLDLTETFLSIGIDELSVSPRSVLPLRQKIRDTYVSAVRQDVLNQLLGDDVPLE